MNMILFDTLPKDSIIPSGDERAVHIVKVLKLKVGDTFRMGVVNESEGVATVTSVTEDGIGFEYQAKEVPTLYPVTLICAMVRPICMRRILREAVSLGVGRIILCGSDTGEKSYLTSGIYTSGEYKSFLLEGAMQGAHAGVSEVVFTKTADKAMEEAAKIEPNAQRIILDNVVGAVPLSQSRIEKGSCVLAIGPERGWSARERDLFISNGYEPKLLGTRVLRTETACSAGVAVLLSGMGLL